MESTKHHIVFLVLILLSTVRCSAEAPKTCNEQKNCSSGSVCSSSEECTSKICKTEPDTIARCQIPTCNDAVINGLETDVDCGGSGGNCSPCSRTKRCKVQTDCAIGHDPFNPLQCINGFCFHPSCYDRQKNGSETDIDCGGYDCLSCKPGQTCSGRKLDCDSLVCTNGVCQAPTCNDKQRNQGEIGTDCGGPCSALCADYETCIKDSDCQSGICHYTIIGVCIPQHCRDGKKSGTEPGTDCGYVCRNRCPDGEGCSKNVRGIILEQDCLSFVCEGNICQKPTCKDLVPNGQETDTDCGGAWRMSMCPPCGGDQLCIKDEDCVSMICQSQFPKNTDNICTYP